MTNEKQRKWKRYTVPVLVLAAVALMIWWGGPRRISRVVPEGTTSCRVYYMDLRRLASSDFSGSVTLDREETEELISFLDRFDLGPVWKASYITEMDISYTLGFWTEEGLKLEVTVTDRGEVEIGKRTYRLTNWTEKDALTLERWMTKGKKPEQI